MTRESIICEPGAAEYEKIRKFVIGQLAKSGESPMRLASNREIARRFGVTHPTVIKALKDLVADGFLTIKPGVGTFTNPGKWRVPEKVRLIGALSGDGRTALLQRMYWQIASVFSDTILGRSESLLMQHCYLTSSLAGAAKEIAQLGVDAAIWFSPSKPAVPSLASLKKEGMPVLSVCRRVPGVSSFSFDFEADNYHVAEMMLAEGRRKILLVLPPPNDDIVVNASKGVAKAFGEQGIEFNHGWVVEDSVQERSGFGRMISALKPDGIIFNCAINPYWETVRERIDIVNGCRLYSGAFSVYEDMGYVGYMGVPDLAVAAEAAADNLTAQFESSDRAEILDSVMKMKIVRKGMRRA